MKITLQKVAPGEEEIIIKYHQMSRELSDMVKKMSGGSALPPSADSGKMSGMLLENSEEKGDGGREYFFFPDEVYYFESVDGVVYACLEKEVYRIREKLEDVVFQYEDFGIVRCSRTMAVNLYRIEWLESQTAGRILASLQNKEKILISRKYAGLLRRKLKEGGRGHGR